MLSNKVVTYVLAVIAIIGVAASGFLYYQYQKDQKIINSSSVAAQLEAADLVKKVSVLMLLPKDEQPTVATVNDYKKLKDQPFFKDAKNGDKLLIFPKASEAILYDPKANKIIAVGPVNLGQNGTPIRIALLNGTPTGGLTNTVEQQLKAKINNITVSVKGNAKNTYTKTLIVDLTGNQQKSAADLAAFLDGQVGNLPQGETAPANTDLLVIIGK